MKGEWSLIVPAIDPGILWEQPGDLAREGVEGREVGGWRSLKCDGVNWVRQRWELASRASPNQRSAGKIVWIWEESVVFSPRKLVLFQQVASGVRW